jgi:hypothetical protein
MTNSYKNLIGANIILDIDYNRMLNELLALIENNKSKIKTVVGLDGGRGDSILLRTTTEHDSHNFWDCKMADINSWSWDESLDIPYTRSVISSLPISPVGMVIMNNATKISRVNEHVDWNDLTDYEHTLGLTIRLCPSVDALNPFGVWVEKLQKFMPLIGQAFLLNDSNIHYVMPPTGDPSTWEDQMFVKILGKFDYSWFESRIDPNCCYYR